MSSSSTPRPRGSGAKGSFTSPLAQAPTFSPPAHPRPASPLRRSFNSDATESNHRHSGSTIRIVNDPGNDVYDKFPLPSEPSQILPPPRNAPGYAFETSTPRVSSGSRVANAIARFEGARSPPAQPPLQRPKGSVRHSLATNASEEDTLVGTTNSRSSLRFSQDITPHASPPPVEYKDFETDLDVLEEETSSLTARPTIRAVPPSSSGTDTVQSAHHTLSSQASDASFASATPTGSPAQSSNDERNTYSISRPISKVPNYTFASEVEGGPSAFSGSFSHRQPVLKPSTESFAYSNISSTSIEPEEVYSPPSPPTHAGSRNNYSTSRSPSDTSLAEFQNPPTYISRMQDRGLAHTWSSQLSTIASVSERDSRSYGRNSTPLFRARSQSQDSYGGQDRVQITRRRGQTVGSTYSSDNMSTDPSESAIPLPLFSPGQSPQQNLLDEKNYEGEDLDTISPLPSSVPLRMKNSGYLRRQSSDTSLNSSRPNSSHSDVSTFNRNIIPAWARAYYKRGERISIGGAGESESSSGSIRLGSSHSGRSHTPSERYFPGGVYRPRNRPHQRASFADTMSMSQSNEHLIDDDGYMVGPNGHPLSTYSTPHLRTDRRERPRYSFWGAPSLDSDFGKRPLSRQNRQIFLFSLGFIFPLAWMIASCLPLPFDPSLVPNQSQVDLEQQQFAAHVAALDNKAYQKANWWRNLNRVMSGVGTLLIGVIIVLAILASRMA